MNVPRRQSSREACAGRTNRVHPPGWVCGLVLFLLGIGGVGIRAQLLNPLAAPDRNVELQFLTVYPTGHVFTNYPGFGPAKVVQPPSETVKSVVRIVYAENPLYAGRLLGEILEVSLLETNLVTPRITWIDWQPQRWGPFSASQFELYREQGIAIRFEVPNPRGTGTTWIGPKLEGYEAVYPRGFAYPTNAVRLQLWLHRFYLCLTTAGEYGAPMPRPTRDYPN